MTSSSPRTFPVIIAVVAAVVTWIASAVTTVVGVQNMDLVTNSQLVIFTVITTVVPGIVAASVVGFVAGQRDRAHDQTMAIAAAIGTFAYLLLSSILALLSGNLQIGAARSVITSDVFDARL